MLVIVYLFKLCIFLNATVLPKITLRIWLEHWRMVQQMWTLMVLVAKQLAQKMWLMLAREEVEGGKETLKPVIPSELQMISTTIPGPSQPPMFRYAATTVKTFKFLGWWGLLGIPTSVSKLTSNGVICYCLVAHLFGSCSMCEW